MTPLQISAGEAAPGCREIAISGELDLATAPAVLEPLQEARDAGEHLVINLRECEFIDSRGIAVLVKAHGELAEAGRRLILFGASQQVHRVLEITGLTGERLFATDLEAALAVCGISRRASGDGALTG
jgi:anti-sigma B factor antagonist